VFIFYFSNSFPLFFSFLIHLFIFLFSWDGVDQRPSQLQPGPTRPAPAKARAARRDFGMAQAPASSTMKRWARGGRGDIE
jgi:hypothetical protein